MKKKMEELEKYLRENREDLDRMEELDPDKMWKGVLKEMPRPSSKIRTHPSRFGWKWVAVAASVAALIGWGLFFYRVPDEPVFVFSLENISPEMAEREAELQRFISQKEKELGLDTLDAETFAEVFAELSELEGNAAATRRDLATGQVNERAVETLLRQYELKIRILENLSREIEKKQYHEKLEKEI